MQLHHHKINHTSSSYHKASIISLHLRILTYNCPKNFAQNNTDPKIFLNQQQHHVFKKLQQQNNKLHR